MKQDINNCISVNAVSGNKKLGEAKIEIKQEFENYIEDKTDIVNVFEDKRMIKTMIEDYTIENVVENNKTEIENVIKAEIIYVDSNCDSYIDYSDFKCKNEEVEFKTEYNDNNEDDHSTYQCDKVDVKDLIPSGDYHLTSCSNEEEQQEFGVDCIVKAENCGYLESPWNKDSNEIKKSKVHNKANRIVKSDRKVQNQNFTCIDCSKMFNRQSCFDNHLLKMHNCRNITSKIYDCDKCSFATTRKDDLLQHNKKHGIKDNSRIFNCQQCTYETYKKSNMNDHMKKHNNIRDFKCTICSKEFTRKTLMINHLLKIHKCRDNVTCKVYDCNKCSYSTIRAEEMLHHNIKHGIKDHSRIFQCQYCTYETYKISHFNSHVKTHNNILDFKCNLCSKAFTRKIILDNHLLRIHNCRNDVTSKLYECNKCDYVTTFEKDLLQHNIKHGIKDTSRMLKCQQCKYKSYKKSNFDVHIKTHSNIRDFKCTLCSREFTRKSLLNNHLLKYHNCKDNVTGKIYECDKCIYATIVKKEMLCHNIKHGIKDETKLP